jgi:hypothetical protein
MKNFFIDDEFYSNIEDYVHYLDLDSVEDLDQLGNNHFPIKIEMSDLEPMFQINEEDLIQMFADGNEDRFSENNDEAEIENIRKAIRESIDIEKFNSIILKYCYPNGNYSKIEKEDIEDYLNLLNK